jgi:hypothetical protein
MSDVIKLGNVNGLHSFACIRIFRKLLDLDEVTTADVDRLRRNLQAEAAVGQAAAICGDHLGTSRIVPS